MSYKHMRLAIADALHRLTLTAAVVGLARCHALTHTCMYTSWLTHAPNPFMALIKMRWVILSRWAHRCIVDASVTPKWITPTPFPWVICIVLLTGAREKTTVDKKWHWSISETCAFHSLKAKRLPKHTQNLHSRFKINWCWTYDAIKPFILIQNWSLHYRLMRTECGPSFNPWDGAQFIVIGIELSSAFSEELAYIAAI